MKKLMIIALSGAALIGSGAVAPSLAQTNDNTAPTQSQPNATAATQADRNGPPANQISNEVDARIAQLKASLRLTADQEKNWPGLQSAIRDYGVAEFKQPVTGRSARSDRHRSDRPNDITRMRSNADEMTARAAMMKKLADATEPLYNNLDDWQRGKLFQFLGTHFRLGRS
jgi:LTXXQ motif family protein